MYIPAHFAPDEATVDALERVLGMKSGCLRQPWSEDLSRWQALLEGFDSGKEEHPEHLSGETVGIQTHLY